MGSRGSVIPLFKNQILENREITVTDTQMVRYMMTPNQAISLMLKANELSRGGEVFVLKMPIVKLQDLIEVMIGEVTKKHRIAEEIKIKTIGLRPGEKMYEELMTDDEYRQGYELPNMYIIPSYFSEEAIDIEHAVKIQGMGNRMELEPPIPKETLRDWLITEQLI
jgi:FlaA1/EpsC-like NDP-sugar epimerase